MKLMIFIEICFIVTLLFQVCFSDDEVFISMAGDSRYPAVTTEGNTMYMVWLVAEGKKANLYFRRSPDEGKTWTRARKVSNEKSDCLPPAIAVNSGIVHAAWVDYGETIGGELYYARSVDGGDTWEKNVIIVGDANHTRYPSLVCKGNDTYLIWQDGENTVFFKASYDQGRTWKKETLVEKVGTHSCFCFPPAFSAGENELVVAWSDMRRDNRGLSLKIFGFSLFQAHDKEVSVVNRNKPMVSSIICRKSTDKGRTWGKEILLAKCKVPKEMKDEIDNPIMRSDGSLSTIFWLDRRNVELGELYYATFNPGKHRGLLDGKHIYPTPTRSPKRPSVAVDRKGNLHITWATFFRGQSIIHYGAITPGGGILREKRDMTSKVGRYHSPLITRTPSGIMYLFWFDEPKDKREWSKIFMKISWDDGLTWENWEPLKKEM
jgi:hypothetical protein